jgi:hypothetical protein
MNRRGQGGRLAEPNIVAISSKQFDGHMLRAIVREWPGGAPELFLERIDYGDEAEPFATTRQVQVDGLGNASTLADFMWEEFGLAFTVDPELSRPKQYFVRATSDELGTKAHRRD